MPEYGKMIGCDNNFCEYEWFHYSCVGIHEENGTAAKNAEALEKINYY